MGNISEHWCIQITEENKETLVGFLKPLLGSWVEVNIKSNINNYFHSHNLINNASIYDKFPGANHILCQPDHTSTEITFDQFKKYIFNKNMKTVTRKQLSEIYPYIKNCKKWKDRAKEIIASGGLFDDEFKFPEVFIKEAYEEQYTSEQFDWLIDNFPKPKSVEIKIWIVLDENGKRISIESIEKSAKDFVNRHPKYTWHLLEKTVELK